MKYKILGKSGKEQNGLLPMKQSPELEAKKSEEQKTEELCNFIKNSFCVDGDVVLASLDEPIKVKMVYILEDSKRGTFIVAMENIKK